MSLKFALHSGSPLAQPADILLLATHHSSLGEIPGLEGVDPSILAQWEKVVSAGDFTAALDQTLEIQPHGAIAAGRLLLVGLGEPGQAGAQPAPAVVRRVIASAVRSALARRPESLTIALPSPCDVGSLRSAAEGVVLGAYRFTRYLTGERRPKADLKSVAVFLGRKPTKADKDALELGRRTGEAVCLARDLVNEPPNVLTPTELAARAVKVARQEGLKVEVLDEKAMKKAGMVLHLAVGAGSSNPPRFVHLTYSPSKGNAGSKSGKGKKRVPRLVFVGKGLTFDSGGLCIKPPPGMGEMKSDMAGAAAVLGLMEAVSALAPEVEVHGILAAAENMPDGAAYRPGDIFGSLDGKTVEIVNTDAEGRLVLADALAFARDLKPDVIVDAATLTGACVVALGKTYSAYYSADDELAARFGAAASSAGEGFWRMPLIEELKEQLKSDVADLKHVGDRWGGSITAALFLKEFVGEAPWVHCDIAGPALADSAQGLWAKGGTGHPVLTFLDLVASYAGRTGARAD